LGRTLPLGAQLLILREVEHIPPNVYDNVPSSLMRMGRVSFLGRYEARDIDCGLYHRVCSLTNQSPAPRHWLRRSMRRYASSNLVDRHDQSSPSPRLCDAP